MVEYLAIKEDLKGFWSFDENANLENQDRLYDVAIGVLKDKNYQLSQRVLKSSGLIIDRGFLVNHLINKKKQPQLIEPPYILRSINLDNNTIQGLEELLLELNAPVSNVMSDMRSFINNNFIKQTKLLGLSADTAILIIQSYRPRVSIFSEMQVDLFSSAGGNGAFINLNSRTRARTYAYLIHVGTGDLLWSNRTTLIADKNQEKFFFGLPMSNLP